MSLTTAVSGFMVLLLSVSVVQGQDGWGVTYSSLQICAFKGSTVEMSSTFSYPGRIDGEENKLLKTFWFAGKLTYITDIETSSQYSGRVKNTCEEHKCTLRITDLRESDADQYMFRFKTKFDKYFGQTGVTLYIRDPEVVVRRENSGLQLKCLSSCPVHTSYMWFKNGEKIKQENSQYYSPGPVLHTDRYSCALRGNEEFSSPSVYAPEFPSVSVNTSAEIEEGSSVTLTCSSDANPAANYTWYKKNGTLHLHLSSSEAQIVFSSTESSDSGEYYCEAENELGRSKSKPLSIKVQGSRFKFQEKHPTNLFDKSTSTMNIIRLTLSVVMLIPLLLLTLWSRKKKTLSFTSEPNERVEMIELDSGLEFENISAVIAARTEDAEEQESTV